MTKKATIIQRDIQDLSEEIEVLQLELHRWLFADLCKIQAAKGRPLESLLVEQLETFIIDNWDLENDQPRAEAWNE